MSGVRKPEDAGDLADALLCLGQHLHDEIQADPLDLVVDGAPQCLAEALLQGPAGQPCALDDLLNSDAELRATPNVPQGRHDVLIVHRQNIRRLPRDDVRRAPDSA